MLVLLTSITSHEILADTVDIAAGDALDKCARELGIKGNVLAKSLEEHIDALPLSKRHEFDAINLRSRHNTYGLKIPYPFTGPNDLKVPHEVRFSFSPYLSTIQCFLKDKQGLDDHTIDLLRYKIQDAIFNHVVDRVAVALTRHKSKLAGVSDMVCSGGVAANRVLRSKLASKLPLELHFPSIEWCTDNAVMIGVAGIHMFEQLGVHSALTITPIRKWALSDLMTTGEYIKLDDLVLDRIMRVE